MEISDYSVTRFDRVLKFVKTVLCRRERIILSDFTYFSSVPKSSDDYSFDRFDVVLSFSWCLLRVSLEKDHGLEELGVKLKFHGNCETQFRASLHQHLLIQPYSQTFELQSLSPSLFFPKLVP